MKSRKSLVFTLFLVLTLLLVACSSSTPSSTEGEKSSTTTDGGQQEQSSSSGGSEGGTLVFGRGGDSTSLDPGSTTEGEAFKVTENVFDNLTHFGVDNMDLEAGLATDWQVSDDGLTYTFELREGVKFHDDTDFNAEAVVYNFDRWKKGNESASGADASFPYYDSQFGNIIEEVVAVEEFKVEFHLKRPLAVFLKNLAMSPFAIVSPTAIEQHGDKINENPVGTGPFKFVEWRRNDRIVIEKNPDYWKEGYPKLDRVIFRSIPENSARMNALKTGEVDIIDGVNFSDVPQIEADATLQLFSRPSLNIAYVGLTVTRGPMGDKKVRQALNHAVDKEAIINAFYEGYAVPAINPMPPVVAGYNDAIPDYPFDLDRAKELLAEAGYPDGFEMELWAMPVPRPYMPNGEKVAEAIAANFEKIGVKAKLVTFEWGAYLDKASRGEADAFMLGWTGDNGDADNFLYVLLDEDNIGTNNYAYYENSQLHDILIEAQSEIDEARRVELYKQAQEIIKDDAPWIPLVHSRPVLAGKADIVNFTPHPKGSDLLFGVEFK